MNVKTAYDQWSSQYDTQPNKTRDLEAAALRETLAGMHFIHYLEADCGTGKTAPAEVHPSPLPLYPSARE